MNARTRFIVTVSVLVLAIGLSAGLAAYFFGLPGRSRHPGPEDLRYVPRDASLVAFADVRAVMASEWRRSVKPAVPLAARGPLDIQRRTGIDVEHDIDRVVACFDASPETAGPGWPGLVLARGRLDEARIESVMREHGAHVEAHEGHRILVAEGYAATFVEPGVAAFGSPRLVRSALDLRRGGTSVTGNSDVMDRVRAVDGASAWAVGRFDVLRSRAGLPGAMADQIPAIDWFSAGAHLDGSLRGGLRAEARDEEAARNLRDVVRGLLALAKLQAGSRPWMKTVLDSVQLGGTGKDVSLSVDLPASVFGAPGGSPDRAH